MPLPEMPLSEHVVADYQTLRLSLKAHPMRFLRARLAERAHPFGRATTALRDGAFARTAGVVLVRQRPGKGNVVFMTLEDETGVVNVVVWTRLFEDFAARSSARGWSRRGRYPEERGRNRPSRGRTARRPHGRTAPSGGGRNAKTGAFARRRIRPSASAAQAETTARGRPSPRRPHHSEITGFSLTARFHRRDPTLRTPDHRPVCPRSHLRPPRRSSPRPWHAPRRRDTDRGPPYCGRSR